MHLESESFTENSDKSTLEIIYLIIFTVKMKFLRIILPSNQDDEGIWDERKNYKKRVIPIFDLLFLKNLKKSIDDKKKYSKNWDY